MRASVSRLILALGILAAGSAAGAPAKPPHQTPSLTLYEKADFTGRHASFLGQADTARQAFDAKSAKTTGLWTLCEGRDPASKCQTVNGAVAKLKIIPAIVHPGVEAVALYEEPDLKGRRVVYSFASDRPPPFPARSARTWGGPWSLCDADGGRCQVVDGEHPSAVDVKVGLVKPGARPPQRLQLALAAPPAPVASPLAEPVAPPEPEIADAADPPASEVAEAAPPPPLQAAPEDMPPPAPAEAGQQPQETSPYVDIPLPPRERDAPPAQEIAPPPPAQGSMVQIPMPGRQTMPTGPVRRVAYVCQDGQDLTVLFDDRDQSATVLAGGQNPVALRRSQPEDAGGFFYEGAGHVLFGAGARAGYASDGAEPIDCYAAGARRQLSSRDAPRGGYAADRDASDDQDVPD